MGAISPGEKNRQVLARLILRSLIAPLRFAPGFGGGGVDRDIVEVWAPEIPCGVRRRPYRSSAVSSIGLNRLLFVSARIAPRADCWRFRVAVLYLCGGGVRMNQKMLKRLTMDTLRQAEQATSREERRRLALEALAHAEAYQVKAAFLKEIAR